MSAIRTDPEIMHGVPCFAGTRVPVDTLFDYLSGGDDFAAFLGDFPGVSREQAAAVVEEARRHLIGPHWLRGGSDDNDESGATGPLSEKVRP